MLYFSHQQKHQIPILLFTNITAFISDPLPPAYVLKDMHK
jgi:hypothetical protein